MLLAVGVVSQEDAPLAYVGSFLSISVFMPPLVTGFVLFAVGVVSQAVASPAYVASLLSRAVFTPPLVTGFVLAAVGAVSQAVESAVYVLSLLISRLSMSVSAAVSLVSNAPITEVVANSTHELHVVPL